MRSSLSTLHIVSRFSISSWRAQSQQKRHYFMVFFAAGGWLPAAGWCSLKWWLHSRAKRSFRFLRAFVVYSVDARICSSLAFLCLVSECECNARRVSDSRCGMWNAEEQIKLWELGARCAAVVHTFWMWKGLVFLWFFLFCCFSLR